MSFQPVIPFGGYGGWRFLSRTLESQKASFAGRPESQRDAAYFRENIGKVRTAEELVSDRRLLSVALGAFGLQDDINSKFFIKKVLSDGTLDTKALSNRLADKRYAEFSRAFGFGDYATPRTQLSDFADKLLTKYETKQFEIAVGEKSEELRLALNAGGELAKLAGNSQSADGRWFSVMGSPPLRKVFEVALGLPSSFAAIDLDQQLTAFQDKARSQLGDDAIAQFSDPKKVEDLVRLYLLRSESASSVVSSGSVALALLRG
jgi:hypothetical protein